MWGVWSRRSDFSARWGHDRPREPPQLLILLSAFPALALQWALDHHLSPVAPSPAAVLQLSRRHGEVEQGVGCCGVLTLAVVSSGHGAVVVAV